MTSIQGTVRLRPTRIGFFVIPTDHSAIRKVMRYCACLWGGQFNPIIPVSRQLPAAWRREPRRPVGTRLAEHYIRFFEPDVFVDTTTDAGKRLGKWGRIHFCHGSHDRVQAKGEEVWNSVPKWPWTGKGVDEVMPPAFKMS